MSSSKDSFAWSSLWLHIYKERDREKHTACKSRWKHTCLFRYFYRFLHQRKQLNLHHCLLHPVIEIVQMFQCHTRIAETFLRLLFLGIFHPIYWGYLSFSNFFSVLYCCQRCLHPIRLHLSALLAFLQKIIATYFIIQTTTVQWCSLQRTEQNYFIGLDL